MTTYNKKGSMTVFLSLISVLFLSLLCTSIESARIQGARAKAAAALDMANFSLFGEFENKLLEEYDIFALDGACGGGYYSTAALEWKLRDYMQYNTAPNTGLFIRDFDPFQVQTDSAKIKGVSLLTDENGEAFFQQAVGFMHDNFATEAVDIWLERKEQAEKLQQAADQYQMEEGSNSNNLSELQKQQEAEEKRQKEEIARLKKEAEDQGLVWVEEPEEPKPEVKNPLDTIKQIKKMGLIGLALGDGKSVSGKTLNSDVVSKRMRKKGNLPVKKTYSGLASNLLFQEYLFERFDCYGQQKDGKALDYELEYILCGKNSDEKNLREVIKKLLLMREGSNFVFLCSDSTRRQEADALAILLAGAIPIPGLVAVLSYALLLVWAYAESILDIRILMAGGKLPVWKDSASWHMDLEDIPQILDILNHAIRYSSDTGLNYEGYLQILFTLGKKSKYPLRSLDLVEKRMRSCGNSGFRADHAIVKMETEAGFTIPPLFLKVTNAFMHTGVLQSKYSATGTFAY